MKQFLAVWVVLFVACLITTGGVSAEEPLSVQASFSLFPQDPFSVPVDTAALNWRRNYRFIGTGDRPISGTSSAEPVSYDGLAWTLRTTIVDSGLRISVDWERSRGSSVQVEGQVLYQPYIQVLFCLSIPCSSPKLIQRADDLSNTHRVVQDVMSLDISYDLIKGAKRFVVAPGAGLQLWSVRVTETTEYTQQRIISPLFGDGPTHQEIVRQEKSSSKETSSRVQPFLSVTGEYWFRHKRRGIGLVGYGRYIGGNIAWDRTASSPMQEYRVPIRQKRWLASVGLAFAF